MKTFFLFNVALLLMLLLGSCSDENENTKPAFDLSPYVISDSTGFDYYINGGYYTKDTVYPLLLNFDSLTFYLKISQWKSGFVNVTLLKDGVKLYRLRGLNSNIDTMIQIPSQKIPKILHIDAYHHTAEVSIQILP